MRSSTNMQETAADANNLETSREREVALLLVARKTPQNSKTPKSVPVRPEAKTAKKICPSGDELVRGWRDLRQVFLNIRDGELVGEAQLLISAVSALGRRSAGCAEDLGRLRTEQKGESWAKFKMLPQPVVCRAKGVNLLKHPGPINRVLTM